MMPLGARIIFVSAVGNPCRFHRVFPPSIATGTVAHTSFTNSFINESKAVFIVIPIFLQVVYAVSEYRHMNVQLVRFFLGLSDIVDQMRIEVYFDALNLHP